MITFLMQDSNWLPVVFAFLMGVAMLAYVILDGYDLGVGILLGRGTPVEKDVMIASIGPFWDANETWLVLGVGILLVAFPMAHGIILTGLYLPVALMLTGLILRGVAFDFRAKAHVDHKEWWDRCFFLGSLLAALSQGYMLGLYIVGFEETHSNVLFSLITAFFLAAGYTLVGSGWLMMKTTGALQKKAVSWAKKSLWITAGGLALVSLVTPLVSARIFEKWFTLPAFVFLLPIPVFTAVLILYVHQALKKLPAQNDKKCWVPFVGAMGIFMLGFMGLAYSFFPYIVPDRLTIWEAASAPESLKIILIGAVIVLPCILGYTVYVYRVFWGKVQ